MSNMQVTPGFGQSVATKVVTDEHNQRVTTHQDRKRYNFQLAATTRNYTAGKIIGGELALSRACRGDNTTSMLESLVVTGANAAIPPLALFFFSRALTLPAIDNRDFNAAGNVESLFLGYMQIRPEDYLILGSQGSAILAPKAPLVLHPASADDPGCRVVVVAAGVVNLSAPDDLRLTFNVRVD